MSISEAVETLYRECNRDIFRSFRAMRWAIFSAIDDLDELDTETQNNLKALVKNHTNKAWEKLKILHYGNFDSVAKNLDTGIFLKTPSELEVTFHKEAEKIKAEK